MKRRDFFKELSRQTLSAYHLDKAQNESDGRNYETIYTEKNNNWLITNLQKMFEIQDLKELSNIIITTDFTTTYPETNKQKALCLSHQYQQALSSHDQIIWQPQIEEISVLKQIDTQNKILIFLHWFANEQLLKETQELCSTSKNIDLFVGNLKDKITKQSPVFMRLQSFIEEPS